LGDHLFYTKMFSTPPSPRLAANTEQGNSWYSHVV